MKPEAVYKKAIEYYGVPLQIVVSMEEMSELIKEISKYYRGSDNTYSVTEEIADVEIMLEQLKIIFANEDAVNRVKNLKTLRLEHRIGGLNDEGKTESV